MMKMNTTISPTSAAPLMLASGPLPLLLPAWTGDGKRRVYAERHIAHAAALPLDTVACSDALAFLRALPEGSIDMILTSPPYDNLRTYNGYSWDFEGIARELYRVLKTGGVCVWVVGDSVVDSSEQLNPMRQAIYFVDECKFNMHDTMIYKKQGLPFPDPCRYYQTFEYMFVLSKDVPLSINLQTVSRNINSGGLGKQRQRDGSMLQMGYRGEHEQRVMDNVWVFSTGNGHTTKDKEAFQHPAMFPENLAEQHILSWSNPGQVVLDPFMGSGTTAKMARNLGRHYIGCDISAEYVALALRRLQNTDPYQPTVHANGAVQRSLFEALP